MKKNVFVRVLAALGGVTLWALGLCALAETFFQIPVTGRIGQLLGARTPLAVLLTLVLAILLCAFGVCCLMMLSGKRAVKRAGFVMQKGENGVIGVSVKSIEGLVQTCVKQHDVVERAEIAVVERRDGIVILLNIQEAAGVNIPLAVGALQKQIKQYVTTCTGVDVREVRVMVENTETSAVASPYAVKEPVVMTTAVTAAELHREAAEPEAMVAEPAEEPVEDAMQTPAAQLDPLYVPTAAVAEEETAAEESVPEEEIPAPSAPLPQAVPVVMPAITDYPEEEDNRPLHQRIFGAEEQPVFVPAPPELVIEPAVEESVEAPAAEMAEEVADAAEEAEEAIDANAVLEVVAAIALEEELAQDEYQSADECEYDEEVLAEEASLDGETDELKTEDREI